MIQAGTIDKRVELQSATKEADGMGGFTETWTTQDTVWAAIWPVSVIEQIRAAATTMIATHRIRIRYDERIGPAWRIRFGTRHFTIVSIVNPNERNEMLDLLCKEVI